MPRDRADWLLVALGSSDEPLTPVQLQKSLFLIGKALPEAVGSDYYSFEPYHYGPFDRQISRDTSALAAEGLVKAGPSERGRYPEFSLTEDAAALANQYAEGLSEEQREEIRRIVRWVRAQTFSGLLRAIYSRWPEYRSNSVFQG